MEIEPLAVGFGAEVHDLDVTASVSDTDIARLVDAYDRYHLLLFRECEALDPGRQVEICSWFGELHAIDDAGRPRGEGGGWNVLDNENASGRDVLPFHCDISFMPKPYEGLSLYPTALPDAPTTTSFVSNALAWKALPDDLRVELHGRKARHAFDSSEDMNLDWPPLEQWHPVCVLHHRTGEPLLFITQFHVDAIEGFGENESRALLTRVHDVLYAPERRYEHVWQPGDLMIWDNVAVQHSRGSLAPIEAGPRVMQRVSFGPRGFTEQLEEARLAAQQA